MDRLVCPSATCKMNGCSNNTFVKQFYLFNCIISHVAATFNTEWENATDCSSYIIYNIYTNTHALCVFIEDCISKLNAEALAQTVFI